MPITGTEKKKSVVNRKIFVSDKNGVVESRQDPVTVEEPLQLVLQRWDKKLDFAVIMRTPVLDFELAAGFLFSEGVIRSREDIVSIGYDEERKTDSGNVVIVNVSENVELDRPERNFAVNSSCGVCGKSSINEIFLKGSTPMKITNGLSRGLITELPGKMREKQSIFSETGGIHAAGLFDYGGNLVFTGEDVGRHNAVDKIVGYLMLNDLIGKQDYILQVSGRAGFEIVQKAAGAGISVVSSVSAPSSLAIETADSFNLTLVGFVRDGHFNIYTHRERFGDN